MQPLNPRITRTLTRLAVLLCLTLAAPSYAEAQGYTPSPLWTDAPAQRGGASVTLRQDTFEDIARDASPGVVNIEVELAGGPGRTQVPALGQGTGFFIHSDGYIATNAHVVRGSAVIRVTTSDRTVYDAEIVGLDEETDIALIRIVDEDHPREGFHVLRLADSDNVRSGQWVIAIGNPFGLSHTVTAGIVSAVGRRDMQSQLRLAYADFIQIDAAINFGNSGGPLLNLQGHVVGMNTAIQTGNDLGFAIPTNMIREVLPLLARGEVRRAWSGLSFGDLSAEDARVLPHGRRGARIQNLHDTGPGAAAGLQIGDIILGFNGRVLEDAAQLRWWIAVAPLDTPARFDVLRGDERVNVLVTLRERPADEDRRFPRGQSRSMNQAQPRPPGSQSPAPQQGPQQGAPPAQQPQTPRGNSPHAQPPGTQPPSTQPPSTQPPSTQSPRRNQPHTARPVGPTALGITVAALDGASPTGVRVLAVEQGGAAALAGLLPGDILTHIDDAPLASPQDFLNAAEKAEQERRFSMRVQRGNAQIFLHVRISAP